MSDARKVLVTGVAGFIGSHVARVALLSGLAVRGTVRGKSYGVEEAVPGVELVEVDLLSSSEEDLVQALTDCDFLAHVASPFPGASVGDEEMQTAVEGTARMLRAAKKAGVTRVVLTSSVAASAAVRMRPRARRHGRTRAPIGRPRRWRRVTR